MARCFLMQGCRLLTRRGKNAAFEGCRQRKAVPSRKPRSSSGSWLAAEHAHRAPRWRHGSLRVSLVCFAAARAVAASFLSLPLANAANVDGAALELSDLLAEDPARRYPNEPGQREAIPKALCSQLRATSTKLEQTLTKPMSTAHVQSKGTCRLCGSGSDPVPAGLPSPACRPSRVSLYPLWDSYAHSWLATGPRRASTHV